jgi:dTDP-4-amino-4,6-dideoxygalactose transaminase
MQIPLVDLQAQYNTIAGKVDAAVINVLRQGRYILGENVGTFEKEFAAYLGRKCAVGVASGTDALELALKSLGIGPGDEVITTPFTYIATVEAIISSGARPVLADISLDDYCIDPGKIAARITPRTKAIMPVHLYGHPCAMDEIMSLAKKHDIHVVEDCAQSIGARYRERLTGAFGVISCYSFFPSKNLGAFGDGGIIATDSDELAKKIKCLRVHGSKDKYFHVLKGGRNSRLDEIQAAILRVKLPHIDEWNALRRKKADYYTRLLSSVKEVVTPREKKDAYCVWHLYVIRAKKRDELRDFLEKKGVSVGVHYPLPLHLQESCKELGYSEGDFPNTESVAHEVLSLPIYPEISEAQQNYVSECVREFYAARA